MNIIKINNDFVNMFDECYLSTEEFEAMCFLDDLYFRNIWKTTN